MVGVPGKYKGCETCRARRVKCDNQRPYCKKCLDNGRQCAGYERETVFIIGTIQDEGRCSSHPPRVVKSTASKKGGRSSSKKKEEEERLAPVPVGPLQPAWDDLILLTNAGKNYRVQIAALQTSLQQAVRGRDEGDSSRFSLVSLPPYEPSNPRPFLRDDEFDLRSQCLVHLDESTSSDAAEPDGIDPNASTDSVCLFLYQHNNSVMFSSQAPWRDPSILANPVRQAGPTNFRTFPNHHFFVRVYRHNAIGAALLNRKSSFLASPEWLSTPWELHPKSAFDRLLDVVVFLPSLFSRADRIFPHDPTLQRRLMAQDLLANCLNLERQLDAWHAALSPSCVHNPDATGFASVAGPSSSFPTCWISEDPGTAADPSSSSASYIGAMPSAAPDPIAQIPFADTFSFNSSLAAVTAVYYWTALILFYPCIERLHETIFHRVMDTFPQTEPALPRHLQQLNPHRYSTSRVRELAANVCRSLDFALAATAQPDVLVVPLFVVHEFYAAINESTGGDGQLELMWCEGFRQRLQTKGADIVGVIRLKTWADLASY